MNIKRMLIVILALAIFVCGCGYDNNNSQEITMAVLRADSNVLSMVEDYNLQHDKKVTIIEYWPSGNPIDYEDAMTKFTANLTGKNAPDIIYLDSQMNWYEYAEKNVFEDLSPYIERSEVISRTDYFENALFCGQYNEKQIAVPLSFMLMTLIGNPQYVNEDGWSVDDFVKYRLEDRSVEILQPASWEGILTAALKYSMDEYIDWDRKIVDFDKDSFRNLLIALENIEVTDKGSRELDEMIYRGELISRLMIIGSASPINGYRDSIANNWGVVGFPSNSGEQINNIQGQYMFCLSADSDKKVEGWEFIEYVLANSYCGSGFPSKKDEFDKVMQEALTTDEEWMRIDESEYELVINILDKAKPWDGRTDKVITIIEEEVSSYLSNQKSIEEVIAFINSRVGLLISE